MSGALAVIGGTGLNQWPGLADVRHHAVDTPWGAPSGVITEGQWQGHTLMFMARHGAGHTVPPHAINYRANIAALAMMGVRRVVAVAAVGGIAPWCAPGTLALPDDLIDYTSGRDHTYADGGPNSILQHVEMTPTYDAALRADLRQAAAASSVVLAGEGVLAVTNGPRLETAAEVRRLARDGCDMVGMTGMPEAALAREKSLAYACLAVSVNWAAGLVTGASIHAEIEASVASGMAQVQRVVMALLSGAQAHA
jgi:5'-methylthioinosine phosphorylase